MLEGNIRLNPKGSFDQEEFYQKVVLGTQTLLNCYDLGAHLNRELQNIEQRNNPLDDYRIESIQKQITQFHQNYLSAENAFRSLFEKVDVKQIDFDHQAANQEDIEFLSREVAVGNFESNDLKHIFVTLGKVFLVLTQTSELLSIK